MRIPALAPRQVAALSLGEHDRRIAHMAASLLLDYPDDERRGRFAVVEESVHTLPEALRATFDAFLNVAAKMSQQQLEVHFTSTFDLKRTCCPYLSYYAAGDTHCRSMALARFVDAYRAAGWDVDADELPDYLPMVLEFSALSESAIAGELLSSHRAGIEVLRAALEKVASPYAHLVEAVCLSLPPIDEATRQRYLDFVDEGPPQAAAGVSV